MSDEVAYHALEVNSVPRSEVRREIGEVLLAVVVVECSDSHECVFLLLLAREVVKLLGTLQHRDGLHIFHETHHSVVLVLAAPDEVRELLLVEVALFALLL